MKIISYFLLLGFYTLFAFAPEQPLEIKKLEGTIVLDGIVNEKAWQEMTPFKLVTHWPVFGKEPSDPTEIRITYDSQYIYFSGIMNSHPDSLKAISFKRDLWTSGTDYLTLILDTYNDNETALYFTTTPTGSRTDCVVSGDAGNVDPSWNTFWEAEAAIDENGWSAEMRIPFASLGFQDNNGFVEMGMSLFRYTARKNELDVFPAIEPNWGYWSMAKPSQMKKIIFQDIKSDNPIYITPYALGGVTIDNKLNDPETKYITSDKTASDLGLDIRYNVTDNLTLDFSFNTDFAQVEADDQQVNLTRFSLFFPEKRRFFLERANIFDFNFSGSNRLFYSRQIGLHDGENVTILGGARLTGRAGAWDIGLLNVQTGHQKNLHAENFSVVRLKKHVFNQRSYMGGMATNRIDEDGHYNSALGLDLLYNVFDDDFLSASIVQTYTDTLSNSIEFLNGSRFSIKWERKTFTDFVYAFSYERAGKKYLPGAGFEFREDFSHFSNILSYGWVKKDHPYLQRHKFSISSDVYARNTDGSIETVEINPFWDATFISSFTLTAGLDIIHENLTEDYEFNDDVKVLAGDHNFTSFKVNFETPYSRELSASGFFNAGTFYDGTITSFGVDPIWNFSKYLEISGGYQFNDINFKKRNQRLENHIVRLKGQLTFNTKFTLSLLAQYNSGIDLVLTNTRFRYNPSEGHDLYLVYNELFNTERERLSPILPVTKNRTVLAKYTYTFTL